MKTGKSKHGIVRTVVDYTVLSLRSQPKKSISSVSSTVVERFSPAPPPNGVVSCFRADHDSYQVREDGWAEARRERGERGYPQPTVYGRLLNVRSMAITLSITDTLIIPQIAGGNQEIWR